MYLSLILGSRSPPLVPITPKPADFPSLFTPAASLPVPSRSDLDNIPIDPVLLQLSAMAPSMPPHLPVTEPHGTVGGSSWPPDIYSLHQNFVLSEFAAERDLQIKSIRDLIAKYGIKCISMHQFEWLQYATGPIKEEWLPIYTYRKGLSVRQIWKEWAEGVDGYLSVRQLCEGWEARWR